MKLRVWVIDDCLLVQKLMRSRCASAGAEVVVFGTGDAAIAALLRAMSGSFAAPEIMFIDNDMPGFGGLDVVRFARRMGFAGVLVVCTGTSNAEVVRRAKGAGADGVIEKGSDRSVLAHVIGVAGRRLAARLDVEKHGRGAA